MTDQNESPDAPKKKIRWDIIAAFYSISAFLLLVLAIFNDNVFMHTAALANMAIAALILILNKRAKKKAAGK